MNKPVEFRPQTFSLTPYDHEDGSFSLKNYSQKFTVTNVTLENYKIFLANNPNVYTIKAIPVNEIECMICETKMNPHYFKVE